MRSSLVNALTELTPHLLIYPGATSNYTATLCESTLALTPGGNSPDTWRAMEALDCGCVPVMEAWAQAYYARWLPHNLASRFLILETDGEHVRPESARALVWLVRNATWVEARRLAIVDAYDAWRRELHTQVASRLAALTRYA
jgi:hypothetical protein